MPLRLVLDTNIWLDWLVFEDPGLDRIKAAVQTQQAQIFISSVCEDELTRVLTYKLGKIVLEPSTQAACLGKCRSIAMPVPHNSVAESPLPVCRDLDDQKFLELASTCHADFLVTKDAALLKLDQCKPSVKFRIIVPAQFRF